MAKIISKERVYEIISYYTQGLWKTNGHSFVGFSDDHYAKPFRYEIEDYIRTHRLPALAPHLGEGFDCDDYAYAFKGQVALYNRLEKMDTHGLCVGIAWGWFSWKRERHAVNWVILNDERLLWIEPQDGRLYGAEQCTGNLELMIL